MHANPVDHPTLGEVVQGPQEVLLVDPEHHYAETMTLAKQTDIDASCGSAQRKPIDEMDFSPHHPVGTGRSLLDPINDIFR